MGADRERGEGRGMSPLAHAIVNIAGVLIVVLSVAAGLIWLE